MSERPAARSFRDLVVWRKAHEFALAVYTFTKNFPKQETYGLTSQMRRAAVSVPANIAEGFRRRSKAEKAPHEHSGRIARGEPLLSDPGTRSWLRRCCHASQHAGRSQPPAQRLQCRDS